MVSLLDPQQNTCLVSSSLIHSNRLGSSPAAFLSPIHPIMSASNTSRYTLGSHLLSRPGKQVLNRNSHHVTFSHPSLLKPREEAETKEQNTDPTETKTDIVTQTCNHPNLRCLDLSIKMQSLTVRKVGLH